MCWIPRYKLLITSNLEALTPACFRALQRHEFDRRRSCIPHVCTLAIERKRSKPRLCDKGRMKIILGTENKRVLVLH